MLIYDFVNVECGLSVANAWLIALGAEIARAAAETAAPTATITLGPPRNRADALVVPLAWSADPAGELVELQGDLQTAWLARTTTHLSLSAQCRLAVKAPGRRVQEQQAQRSAELSVRSFLGAIGAALEARSEMPPP